MISELISRRFYNGRSDTIEKKLPFRPLLLLLLVFTVNDALLPPVQQMGRTGATGQAGSAGYQGSTGATGRDGRTGSNGWEGRMGQTGGTGMTGKTLYISDSHHANPKQCSHANATTSVTLYAISTYVIHDSVCLCNHVCQ